MIFLFNFNREKSYLSFKFESGDLRQNRDSTEN